MKKVTKTCATDLAIAVSRFGHDPVPMCLEENATVREALDAAEIEIGSNEKLFVAGVEAGMDDVLEDGDVLSIVTPKQAGL